MNATYMAGRYIAADDISPSNTTFPDAVQLHPITELIEMYMIPVLCGLGFIANTAASIVFLQKSLRSSSCGVFLAARGFTDNGFLSTLLIIWVSRMFKLQLGAISGTCCFIIFISYVCGCMSVWLVVFVTIENYVRICRPFMVNKYCTHGSATIAVMVLSIVTVSIYSFPFWAMNPEHCIPYDEYYMAVQALVYLDTLITLVLPFLLISILMTTIVYHVIKSRNRRERRISATTRAAPNTMAKVTKMLFAVSLSFVVLSLPSHVNRLRLMVSTLLFYGGDGQYSSVDEAVQQVTLLVYYMSLSLNIIVYMIFGSKFRETFGRTFCSCGRCLTKLYDVLTCVTRERRDSSQYVFLSRRKQTVSEMLPSL